MDLTSIKTLDLAARGGADTISVGDLADTGLSAANLDLSGTPGTDVGDGAADTVILNGSDRPDHVDVSSAGGDVLVCGLIPTVTVAGSEPADVLAVNTLGGEDRVSVDPDVSRLITPVVDLGADH
jgi:hypothetical protein